MSNIKVGDYVEVLDEAISGRVEALHGNEVVLVGQDGFPLRYPIHEVVKVEDGITVSNFEVAQVKEQKEQQKRGKVPSTKPKQRNAPKMEVDLHIHQLVKSTRGMGKFDILNLQLETAKRQLDFAIDKRIQKVVFIHGVGEGILKEELYYLFKKYDNLEYYDADYQKYGLGATEVYIFQNA
ncbi:Smr/MutS family protein [Flagellimonas meishanensis]|uniref:Smr/MutS family protein n=1 Tax=Flagellimonas meishanensis TaxID=2873264 RepID=UPI001CA67504|nr:Smr/MutS family protein [[Muricauda] meishanensis]